MAKITLHPLIYSFRSREDTTTWGQVQKGQKCELKYEIHIPGDQAGLQVNTPFAESFSFPEIKL
jgi:hypothetical protein